MELCDTSLQDRLVAALDQGLSHVPTTELLPWMRDAADGLDALNAKQVQHRDVKPANLLLLNSGLKVADFGLAKALEQTVASNSGAGTIAYTAPECFKGQLAQQSDQYSLAVTYFQLRTGRLLFDGDQAKVMYGHLELEPDLSQLPPGERAVLSRALAKEASKRWPSCKVFIKEMAAATSNGRACAFLLCAVMWGMEKEYGKAIASFDEAIRIDPTGGSYRCRGVFWLQHMKDYNKAIKDFDQAIRLNPKEVDPYVFRGIAWIAKREVSKAITDLDEAIRLDPQAAQKLLNDKLKEGIVTLTSQQRDLIEQRYRVRGA
jgi:tetratricopeptide (TPR) repeat protein